MTPEDAEGLDRYLQEPRTVREISRQFKVTKVTVGLWLRLLPVEVTQRRQGKRGPFSKCYKINRSKGTT